MLHGAVCRFTRNIMRLNNFFYIFNLRQGTILIAVHQIALSSFVLVILVVGACHAGDMLSVLRADMVDEVERRGGLHPSEPRAAANHRRFAAAHHRASVTAGALCAAAAVTGAYLACCAALLVGAVRRRRACLLPWVCAAALALLLVPAAALAGDSYPPLVRLCGSHHLYHLVCALLEMTLVYAVCAVCSFAAEAGGGGACGGVGARGGRSADERGERLLLLDHAAHCTLLSATQLNKHAHNTHFV